MRRTGLTLSLLLAACASAATAQDQGPPDGLYVTGQCPSSGPIDGSTIFISAGGFYGKEKSRYVKFDSGLACNMSKLKRSGATLGGKTPCQSWGASGMSQADPISLTITMLDPKSFSVASRDPGLSESVGKTWTWCR